MPSGGAELRFRSFEHMSMVFLRFEAFSLTRNSKGAEKSHKTHLSSSWELLY
jgi:hypothetical protein